MAAIALNKSSLQKQREQKKLYEKLLPSLDLKRRQLTLTITQARRDLAERTAQVERLGARIGEDLPMLAYADVKLSGLVRVTKINLDEENVVGVRLPRLSSLECAVGDYSLFATPAYVDAAVERLKEMAEARINVRVGEERVKRLEVALRRVTQRVNLFDKKLIPEAAENIRRIKIYLSDADRTAVVRSKLSKQKRQPTGVE
jgi:V/A-type H+/Na+-transporting ATPase subunit D